VVRRLPTPGSRRALYEATDDVAPMLEALFARVRLQLAHLQRANALLAAGRARERLRTMIQLHEVLLREFEGIMDRRRRR
jgi:DNA-binding transcriptional regulator GbsR (MarR family)